LNQNGAWIVVESSQTKSHYVDIYIYICLFCLFYGV
jgi:hypothetical protein